MIVQVSGPPCAGKSTWIQQHAQPGDTILDDILLAHLAGGRDQATPEQWRQWWHHIDTTVTQWPSNSTTTLYYVQGNPSPRHPGVGVHVINPGSVECHQRATRDGRPAITHRWIDTWFTKHGQPDPTQQAAATTNRQ